MEVDFDEVSSMGRRFHSVYGVMEFIIIYVGLREFKCFFFWSAHKIQGDEYSFIRRNKKLLSNKCTFFVFEISDG